MNCEPSRPSCELHLNRRARERYGIDAALFRFDGRLVFADVRAAREVARRIAERAGAKARPGWPPSAGTLNAVGLLDELYHALIQRYRSEVSAAFTSDLLEHLANTVGAAELAELLTVFVDEFPPEPVFSGVLDAEQYLADPLRREAALEELILLWLTRSNPACDPLAELFDDQRLRDHRAYGGLVGGLTSFLAQSPVPAGERAPNLLDLLLEPIKAAPHDLAAQLRFIAERWGGWLGEAVRRLLSGLDLLAEENRPWFPPGPGPVEVPVYPAPGEVSGDEPEAPENYSTDLDWMPNLVLLAKNAYVWLEQLSRAYGRPITTLDQVPDRELDLYAKWGLSGLWLIGVWERSRASRRIKQMMGDHDAAASAYSLLDYTIAADLGGEGAYFQLKERAAARGVRMATDMVPNHVGIDSRWVVEHPDWFIASDHPPFPGYSFNGPDLCDDERVGIYLEDHYYDRSDAAVVFKRFDHWTGDSRYIYHGNDGTSMPWNDTAQLNYLIPEVREAVIQTILHVARLSPVIRFDAAMTLAKKPYQRLWFPEPGSGGDIPSRSEHGMTRAEFDRAMPEEFWRQVVDRVAAEAPDTLLLAEAFWLLEGYFVRTLGMHRVYNSAFMNMLRDEKNAEYRQLIKNTLEYDPQILKRYVNFMSNPDEETAIEQFGVDDKYFGVATLMATLPGLPMFGHGQIEGYREKYGMEFRRPRWDESPDAGLLARHERQVFPLLKRRRLFAEVEHFLLFDLVCEDGSVDENVFAYSNRRGDERVLVVYHNRFGDTRGWLRLSTAVRAEGEPGGLARHDLVHGLGLSRDGARFVILRELVSDCEYILPNHRLQDSGLWVELFAYGLQVFVDIREVEEGAEGRYGRLCAELDGRPVPRVARAIREIDLAPILDPLRELLTGDLLAALARPLVEEEAAALLDRVEEDYADLLERLSEVEQQPVEASAEARKVARELAAVLEPESAASDLDDGTGERDEAESPTAPPEPERLERVAWILLRHLPCASELELAELFDHWLLEPLLDETLTEAGLEAWQAGRMATRLGVVAGLVTGTEERAPLNVAAVLGSERGKRCLGVNEFAGASWYQGEALDTLLDSLERMLQLEGAPGNPAPALIRQAAAGADYHFDTLLKKLRGDADPDPSDESEPEA